MSGITSVGGSLMIEANPSLSSLDGLSNLTTVGGNSPGVASSRHISNNARLTSLDGLGRLSWGRCGRDGGVVPCIATGHPGLILERVFCLSYFSFHVA